MVAHKSFFSLAHNSPSSLPTKSSFWASLPSQQNKGVIDARFGRFWGEHPTRIEQSKIAARSLPKMPS
jgi:hypothetical protein